MEKVSIIVPVYNVQQYISQCLDSILNQSYTNWEAILVDDGSTDLSGHICESYAQRDVRFIVIHQENGGAACAKNTGLDAVSGDFVAFIDSDDYVESNWLATTISVAQKNGADVVEYNFDKIYRDGSEQENLFAERMTFSAERYLDQYVKTWTSSLFWNKLFRVKIVKDIRFKSERRCIDDEFFTYKVLTNAVFIIRIPDVLYHYRQRSSSAVYNPKNQYQITKDSLDVLIERYLWISRYFPEIRQTYLRHDIEVLFYFSTFSHTDETVRQFRRISKFYLCEVTRHRAEMSLLKLAVRLQFVSAKTLRLERHLVTDDKKIEVFYK